MTQKRVLWTIDKHNSMQYPSMETHMRFYIPSRVSTIGFAKEEPTVNKDLY